VRAGCLVRGWACEEVVDGDEMRLQRRVGLWEL
jgi:hypothetical protein